MSTKLQLREAIKREGRIKAGANLDALVDDIVADILRDYCNLTRQWELLKEGVVIPLVAGQQSYSLPADFMNMGVLRYGRGPNPSGYRVIDLQTENVSQTSTHGWPRFYRMIRGPKISFWPYANIVVADVLLLDYYIDPASIYVADGDEFPVAALESAVKKDAIARVQRFHSSLPEAQMTDRDSAASFNASNAAT